MSSKRKQHYSFIQKLLLKKSIQVIDYVVELTSIQCSCLEPQLPPRYGSGTRSMPFPRALAVNRRILGGWQRSGWIWCCGRSCRLYSRRMTKRSCPAGSGRRRRLASERRVQSCSTPSEAKPGSLWTCGPAPSPAATPRVCHRPPDCTSGSPHRWGVSSMIAGTFSMNSLVRVFLAVSSALGFRSTTSEGSSDALSCALKR